MKKWLMLIVVMAMCVPALGAGVTLTENASPPTMNAVISSTTENSTLKPITAAENDGAGTNEKMAGQTFKVTTGFNLSAVTWNADQSRTFGTGVQMALAIMEDTDADDEVDTVVGSVYTVLCESFTASTPWKTLTLDTPVPIAANTTYGFLFTLLGPISADMRVRTNNVTATYPDGAAMNTTYTAGFFPITTPPDNLGTVGRDLAFVIQEDPGVNQPPIVTPTASPEARPASPAGPVDPAHPVEGEGLHVGRGSVAADPNLAASLDAGAIDPDGDPLTYAWSVINQPAGSSPAGFNATNIATPTFTADSVLGDYVLEVTVTAAAGDTTPVTAPVTVTVLDNWAPGGGIPGSNITTMYYDEIISWNANSSDPEGDALTFLWTADPAISFDSTAVEDPNVSVTSGAPGSAGVYTLTLDISDFQYTSPRTQDMEVFDNVTPTVDAGDDQIINLQAGGTAQLAGVVTDDIYPKPYSLTTGWTVFSKEPAGAADPTFSPNPSDPVAEATFTEVGTYVLQLSADDTTGAVTDNVTITVDPRPYARLDLNPSDDTFVYARAGSTSQYRVSNYGGRTETFVDDIDPNDTMIANSVYRFDATAVPGAIKGASLSITAKTIPSAADSSDTLHASVLTYANSGSPYNGPWLNGTGTVWEKISETDANGLSDDPELTWANQDNWLVYGSVLDSKLPPLDEQSVTFNVSDFVMEEGYAVNLAVTMTSDVSNTNANSRRYQFHSNEAGTAAKRPVLSVTYDPNEAFGPEPMDGEVQVDPDTDLSWFPGTVTSVTNTVYIGTDPDPFTNPDFTIPVAKGAADPSQIILNISPQYPDGLASNTEYYWGVNNGAIDSEIWVFTTQLASDLNGDGVVNLLDFALLSQGWQTIYDINDLKAMTAVWLFGT